MHNLRTLLNKNLVWLETSEQELVYFMRDMVQQRYVKELAAINHLAECVEKSIDDAQPAPEMWLVSPDTLPVNPATVWSENEGYLPAHYRSPVFEAEAEKSEREVNPTPPVKAGIKLNAGNKKLLGKVNKLPNGGGKGGFVPETSEHATNLQTAADKDKNTRMERRPTLNAGTTNHLRRRSSVSASADNSNSNNNVDEQYHKEMAIYHAKRLQFEDKLLKRRAEREKEFRSMGMSAATAKLAAYNDLLLDEQHDMEDFDTRFKPKRRPNSHVQRKPSISVQQRRPTSARAAVH